MNKIYKLTLKHQLLLLIIFLSSGIYAQVPTVKFGANTLTLERYDELFLYDSSTNNPTAWEWNIYDSTQSTPVNLSSGGIIFVNGTNRYSQNPQVYFYSDGNYTVTLRCKNSSGWSSLLIKKNYIRLIPFPNYYLGLGIYGPNNNNVVETEYGNIYDDGGPNLNYHNNTGTNYKPYILIQPCKSKKITLRMSQLKFSDNQDVLYVYDDKFENSSKLLAAWTKGNTGNRTVTAYSGNMYIIFKSNGSGVDSGFIGSYTCERDSSPSRTSVDFDTDSILYNSVPVFFRDKTTGFYGVPKVVWTIDGQKTNPQSYPGLNTTFWTDGFYNVCLEYTGCDGQKSKCKKVKVTTPTNQTKLNFKTISRALNSDTVLLIPSADKADRFVWSISPSSYILLNPLPYPSKYGPGKIMVNENPGDTFYAPHIWFLDSACYNITLTGYNSLDSMTTVRTLTKTNYVCVQDFRKKYGIFGKVFLDFNADCAQGSTDPSVPDIRMKLYDSVNNFAGMTYSLSNGMFLFDKTNGKYKVMADLGQIPLKISCPIGTDTVVQISPSKPFGGVNFPTECAPPGKYNDLGVTFIQALGSVFPGKTHALTVNVNYVNSVIYKLCKGTYDTGIVNVKVTGKIKYQGTPSNLPAPSSISGNIYTFRLKDILNLKFNRFKLLFKTDTNATSNDSILVTVEIKPSAADYNTLNNKREYSYKVRTSYDPNLKETYPATFNNAFNDWFYYTIHFQNTGNAPAFNIRLEDTLDNKLDPETFEVLEHSHDTRVALKNKILNFYFDDIMLPDSNSDEEGSHGFVQYRIKPKSTLSVGTKFYNTAYIYFDYNSAVVTNTTVNECVKNNGNNIHRLYEQPFSIYPNPAHGLFNFSMNSPVNTANVAVYNHMGVLVKTFTINNGAGMIDLSTYPDGIYLIRMEYHGDSYYAKLIKE